MAAMYTQKSLLELIWKETLSDYVTAVAWSSQGNTIAVSSGSGEIRLLQNFVSHSLKPPTNYSIDCLEFSHDGKFLAASGQLGSVTIWKIRKSGAQVVETLEHSSIWIDQLAWSPASNHLAFSLNKAIQIWDATTHKSLATLRLNSTPQDIKWSADGRYLAIALKDSVQIWDSQVWDKPAYVWELMASSLAIAWSSDSRYLASAQIDRSVGILMWQRIQSLGEAPIAETDLPILLAGFPGKVRRLVWSAPITESEPPLLAVAANENIALWMESDDATVGWESWLLDAHNENVLDLDFQPKALLLASVSQDGWICLWENAQALVQILEGAGGFSCLAWDAKGHQLAAGGQQGELLIWAMAK